MAQVLPVANSRCPFTGIKDKSGPPIPAAMMSDRGNIRAELVAAAGQVASGLCGVGRFQNVFHPGDAAEIIGIGSTSSNEGRGLLGANSDRKSTRLNSSHVALSRM